MTNKIAIFCAFSIVLLLPPVVCESVEKQVREKTKLSQRFLPKTKRDVISSGIRQSKHPRFALESGPINFNEIVPGRASDLPAALLIRVFSNNNWELKLHSSQLQISDGSRIAPVSRLMMKSADTDGYVPFQNQPTVIARGIQTSPAGQLVVIDLRLHILDQDPLGHYFSNVQILLEEH